MRFLKIYAIIVGLLIFFGFLGPVMVSSQTDIGPMLVILLGVGVVSALILSLTKKEKNTDEKVS